MGFPGVTEVILAGPDDRRDHLDGPAAPL